MIIPPTTAQSVCFRRNGIRRCVRLAVGTAVRTNGFLSTASNCRIDSFAAPRNLPDLATEPKPHVNRCGRRENAACRPSGRAASPVLTSEPNGTARAHVPHAVTWKRTTTDRIHPGSATNRQAAAALRVVATTAARPLAPCGHPRASWHPPPPHCSGRKLRRI
jgi:hypothetical protein